MRRQARLQVASTLVQTGLAAPLRDGAEIAELERIAPGALLGPVLDFAVALGLLRRRGGRYIARDRVLRAGRASLRPLSPPLHSSPMRVDEANPPRIV